MRAGGVAEPSAHISIVVTNNTDRPVFATPNRELHLLSAQLVGAHDRHVPVRWNPQVGIGPGMKHCFDPFRPLVPGETGEWSLPVAVERSVPDDPLPPSGYYRLALTFRNILDFETYHVCGFRPGSDTVTLSPFNARTWRYLLGRLADPMTDVVVTPPRRWRPPHSDAEDGQPVEALRSDAMMSVPLLAFADSFRPTSGGEAAAAFTAGEELVLVTELARLDFEFPAGEGCACDD